MSTEGWQLFAAFCAAHFLADFWFQPASLYRKKSRIEIQILHGCIHAALTSLALGPSLSNWIRGRAWIAPLVVLCTHVPIDVMKYRWGQGSARAFIADQVAHLVILFLIASELSSRYDVASAWPAGFFAAFAILAGWIATLSCGRYLIGVAIAPFEALRPDSSAGLPEAGRVIGQLERGLVYVLVIVGQASSIGFLVAAKSVFRFGDLKAADERKESEYVIIGTLMSFGFAVLVAFATHALLGRL